GELSSSQKRGSVRVFADVTWAVVAFLRGWQLFRDLFWQLRFQGRGKLLDKRRRRNPLLCSAHSSWVFGQLQCAGDRSARIATEWSANGNDQRVEQQGGSSWLCRGLS